MPEACLRCKLFLEVPEDKQRVRPIQLWGMDGNTNAVIILVDTMHHLFYGKSDQYWRDTLDDWWTDMKEKNLMSSMDVDVWIAPLVACASQHLPKNDDGTLKQGIIDACSPISEGFIDWFDTLGYLNVSYMALDKNYKKTKYAERTMEVPYIPIPKDDWQRNRRLKHSYRVSNTARGTLAKVPPHVSLQQLALNIEKEKVVGLDFEWAPSTGKLHTVAFATKDSTWSGSTDGAAWTLLKDLLKRPDITFVGHDLPRAEVQKILETGIRDIQCKWRDGLIRHWELRNEETNRAKLKDIVIYDTDLELYWEHQEVHDKEKYKELMERPGELVTAICRGDAYASLYYDQILDEDFSIKKEGQPYSAMDALRRGGGEFWDMEMILPTAYMMYKGIGIDMEKVEQYEKQLTSDIPRLKEECERQHRVDPGKAWEVKERLTEYLGRPPYDTREERLKEIAQTSDSAAVGDLIERVLTFGKYQKIYGTGIKQFKDQLSKDGRLHSYLKIGNAVTGRGSSSQPGIESLPKNMRDMICSTYFGEGGQLWTYDRSQSEYRCVAYLSELQTLLDAYGRNEDLHTFTANFFEIERKYAKNINFAGIFDATLEKLVSMLVKYGVDKKVATERSKKLLDTLAPLKKWQRHIVNEAYKLGYIEAPNGRRSYRLRKQQIVNTPIQGWSAYLNKRTVVEFFQGMWERNLESYVWLEFHDGSELNVHPDEHEAVKEVASTVYQRLPDILNRGIDLPFPLDLDVHGYNWSAA